MKYLHGTITIQPDGFIRITNGLFDCEGQPPGGPQEMAQAALNLVLEKFLALPGVTIPVRYQPSEPAAPPMPMQLEREAEMEAYLLINRCQGNG